MIYLFRSGANIFTILHKIDRNNKKKTIQERRTATVTAIEHCELLVLTKEDFDSSMNYFPEFKSLIKAIAKVNKGADSNSLINLSCLIYMKNHTIIHIIERINPNHCFHFRSAAGTKNFIRTLTWWSRI